MRTACITLIGVVLIAVLPPTTAMAAEVDAVAAWSMVPQAKDTDGDGFIDGDGGVPRTGPLSRQPSDRMVGAGNHVAQPHERLIDGVLSWYLTERGFPVRLDACGSRGREFRWTVRDGDEAVLTTPWTRLADARCRQVVVLPEARYAVTLEVRGGVVADRETLVVPVRNILMVVMGDSYASGEGNPRNVRAWLRQPGPFTPYWDDDDCRRSARSAPAQAALRLEQASPTTSVTLVDVSCSGATVDRGLLGPQASAGQATSQVEQAAAAIGRHAADVVTVSIGGNDVGFTSILQSCALNDDCPLVRASAPPLNRYPSVQDGVQAETARLADQFPRIAACLSGRACTLADGRTVPGLRLSAEALVLPTLYPDITRSASGAICSYFTIPHEDFAWARATILDPDPPRTYDYPTAQAGVARLSVSAGSLNEQVAATGTLRGWAPVAGTWSASGESPTGHGVCAGDESWVYGATLLSGFPSASFHPNVPGTRAMGRALAQALMAATDP